MKQAILVAVTALSLSASGLYVGAAHAKPSAALGDKSDSVSTFTEFGLTTPAIPAPAPLSMQHLPGWEGGFSTSEQLRNDMRSRDWNWGNG